MFTPTKIIKLVRGHAKGAAILLAFLFGLSLAVFALASAVESADSAAETYAVSGRPADPESPLVSACTTLTESFELGLPADGVTNQASPGAALALSSGSWFALNQSSPIGTDGVFGSTLFVPQTGQKHAAMGQQNGSGVSNLNTFLMSPVLTLNNGDVISFYTRTVNSPSRPDRLIVKLSTNGASTATSDFSTTLLTLNSGLTTGGYPNTWTQFSATISGLPGAVSGRFAFNYNVSGGGPGGTNSDFIGIDTVLVTSTVTCPSVTNEFVYVLNDNTTGNNIYGYRSDPSTGQLTALSGFPVATGGTGSGLANSRQVTADSANRRLYVINDGSDTVSAYSINATTGSLTALPFSPIS